VVSGQGSEKTVGTRGNVSGQAFRRAATYVFPRAFRRCVTQRLKAHQVLSRYGIAEAMPGHESENSIH
jgi:hypothetical protein